MILLKAWPYAWKGSLCQDDLRHGIMGGLDPRDLEDEPMPFPILTSDELRRCASRLPRLDLAHLPTPLEEVPHFAERIGGARIFLKRDDCTGLLFGGNKTRHNEFVLAEALRRHADMIVWGAGVQSNNCRQTAAACAKLGLECRLYLSRAAHNDDVQGNLLLDHLVGAKIEIVDEPLGPKLDDLLLAKAEEFRAAGRRPYAWDRVHGRPIAAVSYALCLAEIVDDLRAVGLEPSAIYVAAAGATGAGLALGRVALGMKGPVRLVCPIRWPWNVREDMAEVANQSAALLGLPHRLRPSDIEATEDYVGPGYGVITPEGRAALDLLARTEGVLLDPVYTSKAMAALIDDVRQQRVASGEIVVFVHTGGLPAIFAYRDELMAPMR
jgi:1-aminocyclopropane-1-carboxylate deaminase/D-cysteine desulfhydrase-like pyridoxal-dependent ACC family enzyme